MKIEKSNIMVLFSAPDCCGKNTLMHALSKEYDYKYFMSPRSPICNIVYDNLYHRNFEALRYNLRLISEFLKLGAYFVLVQVEPAELVRRAKQRKEKHVKDLETFEKHIKVYNRIFAMCKKEFPEYTGRFLKIDNTKDINIAVKKIKTKIDSDFRQNDKIKKEKVIKIITKLNQDVNNRLNEKQINKIKEIISQKLGLDEHRVQLQSSFNDDLKADSLDKVELIMAFEDHFDIEIADEDMEKIKTVKDIIDYLANKI